MNTINQKRVLSILMVFALFLSACTKEWDDHYNEENFDLPEFSIYDYIESQGDLSSFASMLKSTGYDTILNASQTFTVWAPDNNALSGVDMNNLTSVMEIVQNHIARNRYTTSNVIGKSVKMLSGKYVKLDRAGEGFQFGGMTMVNANQPAKNGLVHTIDNYVPYLPNIWEYITSVNGLDSLQTFIADQTQRKFRPELSLEIGVNDDGNPVYDSVFIVSNIILDQLGELNSEDTSYTMIVPDNAAWSQAYNKLVGLYNIPEIFGGLDRQRTMTQWGIIKDLVYSGIIDEPSAFDSIVSTTNTVYHDPATVFAGTTPTTHSNGMTYRTSELNFPDTVAWINEIRVEAEYTSGRDNNNSNIFARSSADEGVSNNRYILVEPIGTSNIALPSVTFSIPNTLSTSYNIYCVFVPSSFSNPNDLLPMKAKYTLNYLRQTSGRTSRKTFTPELNTTNPESMTKMFVGEFDFEFANIIDSEYDDIVVTLEVTSDVKIEEADVYNRSMRIDCIILEPIIQ